MISLSPVDQWKRHWLSYHAVQVRINLFWSATCGKIYPSVPSVPNSCAPFCFDTVKFLSGRIPLFHFPFTLHLGVSAANFSWQGTLKHVPTGNCIDRGQNNADKPVMNICDGRETQIWTFGFYNSTIFPV